MIVLHVTGQVSFRMLKGEEGGEGNTGTRRISIRALFRSLDCWSIEFLFRSDDELQCVWRDIM